MVYGFDQNGTLYGVESPSGKRARSSAAAVGPRAVPSGTAMINRHADRYFLFNEKGELIIARITPNGYDEVDRAKLIEPTNNAFGRQVVWCAPAYAGKRLYVRNDAECICVDLGR